MKIAVTYNNELVEQHFGQTQEFKIYTIEDGKITNQEVKSTDGYAHGTLVNLLALNNVDTLICGGLGGGARTAIAQAGINLLPGVNGKADDAIEEYLKNSLVYNPDISCSGNHHGEGHNHSHDGSCGSHDNGHTCSSH
ncbi:MAG: NifB/NifX family molybdenum-iron cluster-binding protein [Pleomorphochaeta sp.]